MTPEALDIFYYLSYMLTPSQTFTYHNAKKDCIFDLFNISLFMLSFISCLGFLFDDLDKMNLAFLIFKDNLLTFNHSLTLLNSVCIVMLRVFRQLLLQEIVVSSANSINDSNLLLYIIYCYFITTRTFAQCFSTFLYLIQC